MTKNIKHQNFYLTDIQIVVLKTFPERIFPEFILLKLCVEWTVSTNLHICHTNIFVKWNSLARIQIGLTSYTSLRFSLGLSFFNNKKKWLSPLAPHSVSWFRGAIKSLFFKGNCLCTCACLCLCHCHSLVVQGGQPNLFWQDQLRRVILQYFPVVRKVQEKEKE